jgi:hypothetical protein
MRQSVNLIINFLKPVFANREGYGKIENSLYFSYERKGLMHIESARSRMVYS